MTERKKFASPINKERFIPEDSPKNNEKLQKCFSNERSRSLVVENLCRKPDSIKSQPLKR